MVVFMSSAITFYLITTCFFAVIILVFSFKSSHLIKSVFLSAFSGIGAFFAVNILSPLTGVALSANYITLSVSSIFGIPGVIALLFMH